MKLTVINPNSTVSMTEKIATAARAVVGPEVEIIGVTCHDSPPAIETPEDDEAAVPHVIAAVKAAETSGADACIIACFDDPGLAEARAAVSIPVVGIGEAAFHAAALLGRPWSVVTTTATAVPGMQKNVIDYGLEANCAKVRACNIRVLDLEEPGSAARDKVSAEIGTAIAEDGAGTVTLGCAGMADLAASLSAEHGITVIDGVSVATQLAVILARLPRRAPA
ncbi:aspartate/glutamate racemase family protein [Pseudodonghicola xiamenensis]|uniref:Asp/Glu/hydantoin racemase n=1 Tax=Pseudodonghicola xiamenensis TaxID=337702 RepID=A0A8J3HC51_9RHOB|nr:aspartate/glutamate racemase family protein [Pseudodonghicola xiamenensis]GHH02521.1 Asp/Glu/hydantoin racemase [Pseudodonghicola xiamenensis]